MTEATQPDLVERILIVVMCSLMLFVGCWGLLLPRSLRQGVLGVLSRVADQSKTESVTGILNWKHFILVIRLWSLFAIGMGVALARTIK